MKELNSENEKQTISGSVRQFILNQFPPARRRAISDSDPLLESGIIDSLGVLDVVSFMESEFKITVSDDDLTPENFESVSRMAAFVERKISGDA